MEKILFTHAHLVIDGNKEFLDGALLVNGETIEDVFVNSNMINDDLGNYKEINVDGKIMMPGFFDTHCHGGFGVLFNDCSLDELDRYSKELLKKGTTSFYVTLTNNKNLINQLRMLEKFESKGSRFLGIHIEGPFINEKYSGALNKEDVLKFDKDYLKEMFNASTKIKQMTLAPELDCTKELIEMLKGKNIKVMIGHSSATNLDVEGIDYDGFTHLFNAMSKFDHRNLGLVNVAFDDNSKYAEIIGDGKHIDLSVVKFALKNLRKDRVILISDALKLAGLNDGEFEFEGATCIKKNNIIVRKSDNKIAGSASFIIDEIKNMKDIGLCNTDMLLLSSLNAFRLYGLEQRYGSLIKGKYADLVILDENMNLKNIYFKGELIDA